MRVGTAGRRLILLLPRWFHTRCLSRARARARADSARTAGLVRPDKSGMKDQFEHERLDVYRAGVEFVALADDVAEALPRGRSYLADQLRRAATSIPLNTAESAGEFASADQARFYRIARRSATESAAI